MVWEGLDRVVMNRPLESKTNDNRSQIKLKINSYRNDVELKLNSGERQSRRTMVDKQNTSLWSSLSTNSINYNRFNPS